MSELMKFRLEELREAPVDVIFELEGYDFPVLLTTEGFMMVYGQPYRVSNTGGFFASLIAATGGHIGTIVLFKEVLDKISPRSLDAVLSHEEAHLKFGHVESANAGSVKITANRTVDCLQFELEADRHSAEKHGSVAVAKALEEVAHIIVDAVVPEKTRFRKVVVKVLSWMTIHSGQIKKRRKALLA